MDNVSTLIQWGNMIFKLCNSSVDLFVYKFWKMKMIYLFFASHKTSLSQFIILNILSIYAINNLVIVITINSSGHKFQWLFQFDFTCIPWLQNCYLKYEINIKHCTAFMRTFKNRKYMNVFVCIKVSFSCYESKYNYLKFHVRIFKCSNLVDTLKRLL